MTRPVVVTGDAFRAQRHGGVSRFVTEVVARLARPVHVTGGLLRARDTAALGDRLAPRLALPGLPGAARLAAPWHARLDAAAIRRAPDAIVHPSYYRDPASLPAGHPLVVTLYDFVHERFPGHARLGAERWKAALCARADRVLAISDATCRDAAERLALPASRLRVTPPGGRDWSGVAPRPLAGVTPPFLLWVGPRYAYKNFTGALRAVAGCTAARGHALLCVGGGPLTGDERHAAAAAGVALVRRDADDAGLRWAYEHAAGLVYPSLWEGFGLPVLEALSLGTPVLASDRASLPEAGGAAAFYADPDDAAALAAALGELLAHGRAPDRVAAGRAHAARFTWDRCAALHEAAYAELD